MSRFTVLESLRSQQCFGENAIDVIKERGTDAVITDYAILLGGSVEQNNSIDERTGVYWLSDKTGGGCINGGVGEIAKSMGVGHLQINNAQGANTSSFDSADPKFRDIGIRPLLPLHDIPNNVLAKFKDAKEIEYCTYPRSAVNREIQSKLEQELSLGNLQKTGNVYTSFSHKGKKTRYSYEYNGKQYVRVKANLLKKEILSNGETYNNGDNVWVEVEPVKWLVNENKVNMLRYQTKMTLAKEIIVAGANFYEQKRFMDKYLMKEMLQSERKHPRKLPSNEEQDREHILKDIVEKQETIKAQEPIIQQLEDEIAKNNLSEKHTEEEEK